MKLSFSTAATPTVSFFFDSLVCLRLKMGSRLVAGALVGQLGRRFVSPPSSRLSLWCSAVRTVTTAPPPGKATPAAEAEAGKEQAVASYWGITPPKVTREDGAEWKWTSFRVSWFPLLRPAHGSGAVLWVLIGVFLAAGRLLLGGPVGGPEEASRSNHHHRQNRSSDHQDTSRPHRYLLPGSNSNF